MSLIKLRSTRRVLRSVLTFSTLVVGALTLGGCQAEKYPEDPVDRARLIKQLREAGSRHWDDFLRSEGKDLDALLAYADQLKETTKVAPESCPSCFKDYGMALTRIGMYYETLIGLKLEEYRQSPTSSRDSLETEIKGYRGRVHRLYVDSNRQFAIYFRLTETPEPWTYEWVAKQYAALGNYRQALQLLDLLERNHPPRREEKVALADLRTRFRQGLERQDDIEIEAQVRDEDVDHFFSPTDSEPAN